MTTISPKRKRATARFRLLTLLGALVAVMLAAALFRGPLASLVWRGGVPLERVRASVAVGMGNFFSSFYTNHSLAAENQRLRQALASTSVLLLDRNLLYAENVELKSRLGRAPQHASVLLATVVSRPPQNPYDVLVLDVGRDHDVSVGDMVAAGGSVYIGRVAEVYATASRVVLFSAAGETYSANLRLSAATSSLAISVQGQGGGSLTAEVPSGIPVSVGDPVLFPSITPEFAAQVVAIEEKDQASFKTVYLQLPVNIYSLEYVEVHRESAQTYAQ
jgi:cell shape-determining protein MreC